MGQPGSVQAGPRARLTTGGPIARHRFEDRLAAIAALRERDVDDDLRRELGKALGSKEGMLAAKAAEVVAERVVDGLEAELRSAFDRFADAPAAKDKGCRAKLACLEALRRGGCDDWTLYRRASAIMQMEPVYGGQVDTADELRAVAALGLVESRDPEALVRLAGLLADAEPAARCGAARALAGSGRADAAVALLRLRVSLGETHPEVLAACFEAMLAADPGALEHVAGELAGDDDERVEAALMGIAQSRAEGALAVLQEAWPRMLSPDLRRTALLAIAMLRQDAATRYLLALIEEADPSTAALAVEALEIYRHDEALCERVAGLVRKRGESALRRAAGWAL